MTRQAADDVEWEGHQFLIAGVRPDDPFNPKRHGVSIVSTFTAMFRGWVAHYRVTELELLLDSLLITAIEAPSSLAGASPSRDGDSSFFTYEWRGYSLDFSGGLVVVREPVWLRGVRPEPWTYAFVHELLFERGRLVDSHDHSPEVETIRGQLNDMPTSLDVDREHRRELWRRRTALGWSFVDGYHPRPI